MLRFWTHSSVWCGILIHCFLSSSVIILSPSLSKCFIPLHVTFFPLQLFLNCHHLFCHFHILLCIDLSLSLFLYYHASNHNHLSIVSKAFPNNFLFCLIFWDLLWKLCQSSSCHHILSPVFFYKFCYLWNLYYSLDLIPVVVTSSHQFLTNVR